MRALVYLLSVDYAHGIMVIGKNKLSAENRGQPA